MEDSVAETGEVAHAIANAFQNFGFVVAALGIAISKRNIKGVEDQLAPSCGSLWYIPGIQADGRIRRGRSSQQVAL